MNRWVQKIDALEDKKRHFEDILKRQLNDLDDEFSTLRVFSQELQIRAKNLELQKCA